MRLILAWMVEMAYDIGLENRSAKAPWVRILLHALITITGGELMKEKFEKAIVEVIKVEDDIITTSGQTCGCPWGNQSGNNNSQKPKFPWLPWFWW